MLEISYDEIVYKSLTYILGGGYIFYLDICNDKFALLYCF